MNKDLSIAIFNNHTTHLSSDILLKTRSWDIHKIEYPIVDLSFIRDGKKTLRLRLNCENWNEAPPSIELLDQDGNNLVPDQAPQGNSVFNNSAHPKTSKPFICMIGSLEYHEHDSHVADLWENYKDDSVYNLGEIITQIWKAWEKTI